MKKILLALMSALSLGAINEARAQLALETFNSGLPGTWSMIKVDANTPDSLQLNAAIVTALTNQAWMTRLRATGDSTMLTCSAFSPVGFADRWLISPSFIVANSTTVLTWEDAETIPNKHDSIQIWVSPTAGTTVASFTTKIYDGPVTPPDASGNPVYGPESAALGAYSTQSIRIAFRNHSYNQGTSRIDNVETQTVVADDLALTSITPGYGDPKNYASSGNIALSGWVKNVGYNPVTSYSINYQVGASAPVSIPQTVNLSTNGVATFSGISLALPSSGNIPVKVWVTLTGDTNPANDTAISEIGVPISTPIKKIFYEEPTGTWCGWCVRGIVYMDSLQFLHPHDVSIVSVHDYSNYDPMAQENTLTQHYDSYISAKVGGYPSLVVDRKFIGDPLDVFSAYSTYYNEFAFADMTLAPTISGSTIGATVTVKPAINLSGDYRVELIVTENKVHGTAAGYAQHNYYSTASQNQPLSGMGYNFQDSAATIAATSMNFNYVDRYTVPDMGSSPNGVAGSLPGTMTAGQTYTYNLATPVPIASTWDASNLHVVALFIDNNPAHTASYGRVLNSITTDTTFQDPVNPVAVSNVIAGINKVSVYPNPTSDVAYINFELVQATNLQIQVTDVIGHIVYTVPAEQMSNGNHTITLHTTDFAPGLYNVNILSEQGNVTQRLTVVK